jgi:hypothetical protein
MTILDTILTFAFGMLLGGGGTYVYLKVTDKLIDG